MEGESEGWREGETLSNGVGLWHYGMWVKLVLWRIASAYGSTQNYCTYLC